MTAITPLERGPSPLPQIPDLSLVVDAIGEPHFELAFLSFLNAVSGADHCTLFRVDGSGFRVVAAASLDGPEVAWRQVTLYVGGQYWRRDPAMREARRRLEGDGPSLVRVQIATIRDADLRETIYRHYPVAERVLICGRRANDDDFGLSILRNERRGPFDDESVDRLAALSNTLLALLRKHASIGSQRRAASAALASVAAIEASLAAGAPALTGRERQVSARILFGQTTAGIACDLNIWEESVVTYRKRAYARLGLGSRHELLLWYLDLWGAFSHG